MMLANLTNDFLDIIASFYFSQRCKIKEVVIVEYSNQEIYYWQGRQEIYFIKSTPGQASPSSHQKREGPLMNHNKFLICIINKNVQWRAAQFITSTAEQIRALDKTSFLEVF